MYSIKSPFSWNIYCSPPDALECGEPSSERAWCWARGKCVEGVGGSFCVCAEGFTNAPPRAAECVREYY